MKILVTGGAGFIGSHLCRKLLQGNNSVICIDNFNDYYSPAIKELNIKDFQKNNDFSLVRNDILNTEIIESIFSANKIDIVIHLAARAGVRPSINNAALYEQVNIKGTLNLLEACRKYKISKFVFASSSSVYGGNKKVPFSEEDNVDNPVSPYAATKKAGELFCYTYSHLFDISVFAYRFFTVYGPSQRPEMAIHYFTKNIIEGNPIDVFGDGSSSRDYTYIDDITNTIAANLSNIKGYEVFNLGNSRTVKLSELIELIENQTGKKAIINQRDFVAGDVFTTYADILKAKKMLKYSPETPIEEGIKKFAAWYLNNRPSF
jgi:UDP-glucuronate 4-epimerase